MPLRTANPPYIQPPNPYPSPNHPLRLPGYGLPVSWTPNPDGKGNNRTSYPNAITSWATDNLTMREITMLAVMNNISDKPGWHRKVFRDDIVAKWKVEALAKEGFSAAMFDYCISELQHKAQTFSSSGFVHILDSTAAVIKSDSAIPHSLTEELIAAVKPFEDIPDKFKDWHPHSDEKVLDIVHPSLYPLMYGKTPILTDRSIPSALESIDLCGEGEIIPYPDEEEASLDADATTLGNGKLFTLPPGRYWSQNYQWLPSDLEFVFSPSEPNTGVGVQFTSYINNLHPIAHKRLYEVLEKIIARTIPLWDATLSYLDGQHPPRIYMYGTEYRWPDDGEEKDEWSRRSDRENRILILPEPLPYYTPPYPHVPLSLPSKFASSGLQIILKLSSILLSPNGKERYEGGTWHIEGQLNEHICASSIFYYSQSNITSSRLSFRTLTSSHDLNSKTYGQDDYAGVEEIYGITQSGACVQNLGSVLTKQGRVVSFPNVLQHRVSPFELEDKTKPGYRKILAMFLVDPHVRVISTGNVPPQQREWWGDSLHRRRGGEDGDRLTDLPPELLNKIIEQVPDTSWPISLEEAKKVREDLMKERGNFVDVVNADFEQEGFSFCEH